MTLRVEVNPDRLRWARNRARLSVEQLAQRFAKYPEWEQGTLHPTLKQLEGIAKATHAPFGAFFLSEPWHEEPPIPDFRMLGNRRQMQPTVDLLDTIYLCEQRQDWYRDFARLERLEPPKLPRMVGTRGSIEQASRALGEALRFDVTQRRNTSNWEEALRLFVARAEDAGVLVMINGIVGNNTRRRLDPTEFRGFALFDDLAPVVFINGADAKAAQMFTLAHELAHICLGQSALSDAELRGPPSHAVESWCNRVAAEFLVPQAALAQEHRAGTELQEEAARLARSFKVSTLVVLRRLRDIAAIDQDTFERAYAAQLGRIATMPNGGGNFHATLRVRVGTRFGKALTDSTLAGRTSFSECFHLLGIRKSSTLRTFATSLAREFSCSA